MYVVNGGDKVIWCGEEKNSEIEWVEDRWVLIRCHSEFMVEVQIRELVSRGT